MTRILIVGCGSIGKRHLNNLLQLGEKDILLFRSSPNQLEEHPLLTVFTELDVALAQKPDVVIISNPTALHLDVALSAAQAGCNLFIEKPVSHSLAGIDDLQSIVTKNKLLAVVGFDLRFDPGLRKVKDLLNAGDIGKLITIQAQVGQYLPDWHPQEDYRLSGSASEKKGGGVILDLIHELDYVTWLAGPVDRVSCMAGKRSSLEIETEDVAVITMDFQSNVLGTVNLDYIQRIPSRTCRLICEKGTIIWDYFANKVSWFQSGQSNWQEFEYSNFQRNDRFLAEMEHLLACMRGEEKPHTDLTTGVEVLKLALKAKESAITGKHLFLDQNKSTW